MISKHDIEGILVVLLLVFVFGLLFTTTTRESRHSRRYQGIFVILSLIAFGAIGFVSGH